MRRASIREQLNTPRPPRPDVATTRSSHKRHKPRGALETAVARSRFILLKEVLRSTTTSTTQSTPQSAVYQESWRLLWLEHRERSRLSPGCRVAGCCRVGLPGCRGVAGCLPGCRVLPGAGFAGSAAGSAAGYCRVLPGAAGCCQAETMWGHFQVLPGPGCCRALPGCRVAGLPVCL